MNYRELGGHYIDDLYNSSCRDELDPRFIDILVDTMIRHCPGAMIHKDAIRAEIKAYDFDALQWDIITNRYTARVDRYLLWAAAVGRYNTMLHRLMLANDVELIEAIDI